MSQRTQKSYSESPRIVPRPDGEANVAAPAKLESEKLGAGIEGIVETLADLQAKALLSALEASTRKKGTHMADRTLTADAALTQLKALPHILKRLREPEGEAAALKEAADLRAQVKVAELQKFDDALDEWVNPQP